MPDVVAQPLKLLYILGWGRSGSTLLDNILGGFPSFFSAGEVHYLWRRGLLENRRCGCGRPMSVCPVWHQVLERLHEEIPWTKDPAAVVRLQEDVVRNRRLPRLFWATKGARERDEELRSYREVMSSLLHSVSDITGARVIIDSTKRVPDALAAASLRGIDTYFVHLVRDPRASAFSWARMKEMPDTDEQRSMRRFSTASSSFRWLLWSGSIEILGHRWGSERFMCLRYEDFANRPRHSVNRILDHIGETRYSTPFVDERTVTLHANHTVSGNPSRFRSGRIEVRLDDEWIDRQEMRDRFTATAITLPLLKRFGYPLRPRGSA